MHSAGLVGLGAITAVVLYAAAMSAPLNELLVWMEELEIGAVGLRRILGVHRVHPPPTGAAVAPRGHHLRLRGVHYSYLPGHEVLHGIDLDVPAGEHLAVIGPSGSGKFTLARLLAGLAAPDSGLITIGEVDLTECPRDQLRAELLLLTQEHHVFAATVRENLALPDGGPYTDEQLYAALQVVGAAHWVRGLPDGLDTALGAGEHPVPPAVAQQLALARVVLADPPIVVLDEATASVSNGSARALERAVAAALAGRTVISIAHRLSAARDADRILVLDAGKVAELGGDLELLADPGSYTRLVAAGAQE